MTDSAERDSCSSRLVDRAFQTGPDNLGQPHFHFQNRSIMPQLWSTAAPCYDINQSSHDDAGRQSHSLALTAATPVATEPRTAASTGSPGAPIYQSFSEPPAQCQESSSSTEDHPGDSTQTTVELPPLPAPLSASSASKLHIKPRLRPGFVQSLYQ